MNRYIISIHKMSGKRGKTAHLPNADQLPFCGSQSRSGFDFAATTKAPKYVCGECFELWRKAMWETTKSYMRDEIESELQHVAQI